MIITRFVFQGYIMSMVIKSLLLNFVAKYQFFPFNLFENEEIAELFEHNYKGFCPPPKFNDKVRLQSEFYILNDLTVWLTFSKTKFCDDIEYLSFSEASLFAPLTLLVLLYLPTIIYVTVSSIKFYDWNSWSNSVLDDPVHFIFPIFTNISFYKKRNNASLNTKRDTEKEIISQKKETKNDSTNDIEDKEEVFGDLEVDFGNYSEEIN